MNCLLSGISGFVGSHLATKLITSGHSVFSISRDLTIHDQNNRNSTALFHHSKTTRFDVFFHCAACHPSRSQSDEEIIDGNLNFTKSVLVTLNTLNIKAFVFCSSTSVYGQTREEEINVNSPIINPSLYGSVKLEVENLIDEWCNKNNTVFHIIRMPAIIGQGGHETFIVNLINSMKTGQSISIHAGNSEFNHVVYIDDLCSYMINLGKKNAQSTTSVVGAEAPLKLREIISIIQQHFPDHKSNILEKSVFSKIINISSSKKLGFTSMTTRDIILKQIELMVG